MSDKFQKQIEVCTRAAQTYQGMRLSPADTLIARALLDRIAHLKKLESFSAALNRKIANSLIGGPIAALPENIKVRNEYGALFEMNLAGLPLIKTQIQKNHYAPEFVIMYFDDQLALVQKAMEREPGATEERQWETILNRIDPDIKRDLDSLFGRKV